MPNSANKDWDNSKFNTFHLLRLDENDDRIEKDLDNNLSLEESIDWIEEDLHKQARDIICQMNASDSAKYIGLDYKISLDDYIINNHKLFSSSKDSLLLEKAKRIESYFGEFKPLCKSTLFGSEPSQMFDDGEESNDIEITYDDTRDIAIRCVESLIGMGILVDNEDCNGTFEVQDLIQMEINKVLKLDIDNNFKITIR